jgi:hypothetical protein
MAGCRIKKNQIGEAGPRSHSLEAGGFTGISFATIGAMMQQLGQAPVLEGKPRDARYLDVVFDVAHNPCSYSSKTGINKMNIGKRLVLLSLFLSHPSFYCF